MTNWQIIILCGLFIWNSIDICRLKNRVYALEFKKGPHHEAPPH